MPNEVDYKKLSYFDKIELIPGIGPSFAQKLGKMDIHSVRDLLWHIPIKYLDFSTLSNVRNLPLNKPVALKGSITLAESRYLKSGKTMQTAVFDDGTGSINLIWFNQPYLLNTIKPGNYAVMGSATYFAGKRCIIAPTTEHLITPVNLKGKIIPVYPQTKGLTSNWIRSKINYALKNINHYPELIKKDVAKSFSISDIKQNFQAIHSPQDIKAPKKAISNLSLYEIVPKIVEGKIKRISNQTKHISQPLNYTQSTLNKFIKSLPFVLTASQNKVLEEILFDLNKPYPSNRLIQGDVGSGKTILAIIASLVCIYNKKKVVLMAPTQILASQHYKEFNKYIPKKYKIKLSTSRTKDSSDNFDILIGTHKLLYTGWENVGLVIVDEQHKFGVKQRDLLFKNASSNLQHPHFLTLTATPIPRSVAQILLGDIDISFLDELPKGRIPPKTWIVPPEKRENAYKWISDIIEQEKVQAYIVCGLIDESLYDSLKEVKSVIKEHHSLKKIFPKYNLGLLHGRMKKEEKDKIIDEFSAKKYHILVSTPVIEVGIDIGNANIMVIEDGQRYGLAQLHQLRGRIGRGRKKSYCLVFYREEEEKTHKQIDTRLNYFKNTLSGMKLAEYDMKHRGAGEVWGIKQHGFMEFKVADLTNKNLTRKAVEISNRILADTGCTSK